MGKSLVAYVCKTNVQAYVYISQYYFSYQNVTEKMTRTRDVVPKIPFCDIDPYRWCLMVFTISLGQGLGLGLGLKGLVHIRGQLQSSLDALLVASRPTRHRQQTVTDADLEMCAKPKFPTAAYRESTLRAESGVSSHTNATHATK